ncbi:unnamed protein product [Blepharisma stoltei]|uniref:DOMON domain-containing protein n=1 Tax=Blepharisma stoltei TaxID=1481888 RepID=A0AAU9JYX8_9CILI|nr:unnamed protein product [Blepharisma stoltei]
MSLTLIVIAAYLGICFGGEVFLNEDLILKWTFNDEDESVIFKYYIPTAKATGTWGWVGTGIKSIENGRGMAGADLVSFILGESIYEDRFGVENGYPSRDTEEECQDNVLDLEKYIEGNHHVLQWKRYLNTGDICDLPLEKGKQYFVLYAFGNAKDSDLRYHKRRGSELITFDDDFSNEELLSASFIS